MLTLLHLPLGRSQCAAGGAAILPADRRTAGRPRTHRRGEGEAADAGGAADQRAQADQDHTEHHTRGQRAAAAAAGGQCGPGADSHANHRNTHGHVAAGNHHQPGAIAGGCSRSGSRTAAAGPATAALKTKIIRQTR